MTDNAKVAY